MNDEWRQGSQRHRPEANPWPSARYFSALPWNTINIYNLLGVIWSLFAKFPRLVDQKLQLGQIPVCLNIDKNNSFGLYEVIFSHYCPKCTCEIAHMAFRKADLVIVTPIHIDTREVNQNVIR